MYSKVGAIMQWRSDLLVSERYEDLAGEYIFPLVLYHQVTHMIVRDSNRLIELFIDLRQRQKERGIAKVLTVMTALELPRNDRYRIWLRHYDKDSDGVIISQTSAIQYCRNTPKGMRSEMVEYAQCSLPHIWPVDEPMVKLAY